jgi:hypothetical protein
MSDISVTPWFGGSPIALQSIDDTNKVAYSRTVTTDGVEGVLVWHDCDKHLWYNDPEKNHSLIPDYIGWHPANVGAHTLVNMDPLHLEPSVYWPDCCGLHGFVRDGRWISA